MGTEADPAEDGKVAESNSRGVPAYSMKSTDFIHSMMKQIRSSWNATIYWCLIGQSIQWGNC
ncbi:MAG: hypothetical protein ACLVJO_02010 [[Clostridium] scindens]